MDCILLFISLFYFFASFFSLYLALLFFIFTFSFRLLPTFNIHLFLFAQFSFKKVSFLSFPLFFWYSYLLGCPRRFSSPLTISFSFLSLFPFLFFLFFTVLERKRKSGEYDLSSSRAPLAATNEKDLLRLVDNQQRTQPPAKKTHARCPHHAFLFSFCCFLPSSLLLCFLFLFILRRIFFSSFFPFPVCEERSCALISQPLNAIHTTNKGRKKTIKVLYTPLPRESI